MDPPVLEDIRENFAFFDSWEDKYRFLIDLESSLTTYQPGTAPKQTLCAGVRVKFG